MTETKVEFTAQDFSNFFINRVMPLMKKYKKRHRKPFTSSHADEAIANTFICERMNWISRDQGKQILEQQILGDA